MEVDGDLNSDGGQSTDEQDEPSTPEDKLFFIEGPCTDVDKDDETLRAIRWVNMGPRPPSRSGTAGAVGSGGW